MNKFDFVCLLETFVEDLKTNVFYNFIHFVSPAVKLSRAGRRSGGVLLLIKKALADYVQEIALGVENIITMKLSRRLFGISTDVFLICVYSAPLKSPLYSKSNFNNGISAVEHCLLTITEKYGNVPFLLCGDFNARTGNKQPYHVLDMEYFTTVAQDEQYGAQGQRRSQDSEKNDFGKLFLELCTQFDLYLLNGACEGDERGLYTFVSATGNSVIDYFALSRSIAHLPQKNVYRRKN